VSRRGRAHNIANLRRAARRALPRPVFEFIDGGAEDEVTLARNRDDLRAIALVPRVLRAVGGADTSTTVLGQRVALPVLAAPTGLSTFAHPAGEVGVARGVHGAGSLYMLSGAAACTPEAVAAAATGARPWFQLYLWRDRGLVRDVLARVHEAGFAALALTVDVPVSGRRERDVRNGFTIPPRLGARTIAQGLARPRWSAGFLRAGGLSTGGGVVRGAVAFAARVNAQMDPRLTWETLDWLRGEWERPLLVKGVLHAGDAPCAAAAGCDGVVVSNHGGRQLDGAISAIAALPAVADAVGEDAEVYLDGGVRRGSDVAKALALGARACLVGRPVLYGLASGGETGVRRAIGMLRDELATCMALLGCATPGELTRDHVQEVG
jgi:isopentenyl diphosphate isomerase/L-lactate dehydrogenase-like FMN-dependent dehydrogenase